jgi:antagonist of KipI
MSLRIIKAGLFDSVQDTGRYRYQHLGINPTGAMDRYAAQLANALLGNNLDAAVIEMHFPAPHILFEEAAIICITGADFSPTINDKELSINQPYLISAGSLLKFGKPVHGARAYLGVYNQFKIDKWLNSYSTHTKAAAGGYNGRRLLKDDVISFQKKLDLPASEQMLVQLPWKETTEREEERIEYIQGPEWDWLTEDAQQLFQNASFQITPASDRMGYRLTSKPLQQKDASQLISSAVTFGTIQLLPDGQLIILMADHQTTGGYPRIANVISAHLPLLAQKSPCATIHFQKTSIDNAEEKLLQQQKKLFQIQNECKLNIQKWFDGKH